MSTRDNNLTLANTVFAPARFYRWVYYRCYRYSEKADRSRLAPHWLYAACYLFTLFLMNAIVLFWVTGIALSIRAPSIALDRPMYFFTMGLLLVYIALVRYKRVYHQRIVESYAREADEEQRRGDVVFGWYLVGSLILVLGTLPILGLLHVGLK